MEYMKFFNKKRTIFLIISLLFCCFAITLRILNYKFIISFLNYLFLALSACFVVAWIFMIVKYKFNKLWLKIIVVAIPLLFLMISIPYVMLFSIISEKKYYEEVSPSGKNTVVVFESGFIDKSYSAYPKKGIFYQYQKNGYVSKHDFWGGANIEIEWESNNLALVKVGIGNFPPNKGSNENDIIIVSF